MRFVQRIFLLLLLMSPNESMCPSAIFSANTIDLSVFEPIELEVTSLSTGSKRSAVAWKRRVDGKFFLPLMNRAAPGQAYLPLPDALRNAPNVASCGGDGASSDLRPKALFFRGVLMSTIPSESGTAVSLERFNFDLAEDCTAAAGTSVWCTVNTGFGSGGACNHRSGPAGYVSVDLRGTGFTSATDGNSFSSAEASGSCGHAAVGGGFNSPIVTAETATIISYPGAILDFNDETSYVYRCSPGLIGPQIILSRRSDNLGFQVDSSSTGSSVVCSVCPAGSYGTTSCSSCPNSAPYSLAGSFSVTQCRSSSYSGPIDTVYSFSCDASEGTSAYTITQQSGISFVPDRFGNPNSAISLLGGSYLQSPSGMSQLPSGSEPRTVSLWIKCAPSCETYRVFTYGSFNYYTGFCIVVKGGSCGSFVAVELYWEDATNTQNVCDNAWHHIVVKYDSTKLTVIVDGIEGVPKLNPRIQTTGNSIIYIGTGDSRVGTADFVGVLDDIRVYGRALPASEIVAANPSATASATASPLSLTSSSATRSPSATLSTSSSPSTHVTVSATASQSSSLSVTASASSIISPSATGSPSSTLSTSSSPSSLVTISATSSTTSSSSAFPSIPSTSAFPSISAVPTISSIATLTSSSTSSSTATSSRTSTSTLRAPDLQSPSPSPQPIVNVALSLKNVQLSLFTNNDQLTTTLLSLATAVSSAVGVAPSFVSTRRIRDVTFPLTPSVIWTNPDFAGDVFLQRRLQGGPSSIGSVSIDIQIKVLTTTSASTLSSTLASSISKLATDISQSLLNQGSPLSTATFSVTVEPFTGSSGNVGVLTAGNTSPPLTQSLLEVALPSFVTGALFSAFICVTCYFYKRRSSSAIAPEEEDTIPQSNNWNVSVDMAESKHSQQQQKSRSEPNTDDEPDLIVAKIGADHDTSKAIVGDKMEALKAHQEAATQERIAQREALKARVARNKADEYKKLVQQH